MTIDATADKLIIDCADGHDIETHLEADKLLLELGDSLESMSATLSKTEARVLGQWLLQWSERE